jgi:uncharacterized protein YecT (DUF1311 family)
MTTSRLFLLLSALCAPLAAAAASDPDWPASCDESQQTMNACAHQRAEKADRELNVLYGALAKGDDSDGRRKLLAAQRAWIQYRDLECAYEGAESEGGSLQPQTIADCRNTLTRQRIADFKRLGHP